MFLESPEKDMQSPDKRGIYNVLNIMEVYIRTLSHRYAALKLLVLTRSMSSEVIYADENIVTNFNEIINRYLKTDGRLLSAHETMFDSVTDR